MDKAFIYHFEDQDYQVQIIYKRIKNIHYRFVDDHFLITCPKYTTERMIKSGLDKFAKRLLARSITNRGETENDIALFGVRYPLFANGSFTLPTQETLIYKSRDDLHKKLRKWFLQFIDERTRHYAEIMNAPQYTVKVRMMRTRYGTNNRHAKTITYSLVLMHYSLDIIDSVIIHELTHCFVYNHSDNFYRLLYKYCPNYAILRKKLIKAEFN